MATSFEWVTQRWLGVAGAVRELAVGLPLRSIDFAFQPTGWRLDDYHDREDVLRGELGQRRARAQVWLERLDWRHDPPQHLADVLDRLLSESITRHEFDRDRDCTPYLSRLSDELARVGWMLTDTFELSPVDRAVVALTVPATATGVTAEIRRLGQRLDAGTTDPHEVIGSAKNLVEATAKYVCSHVGVSTGDNPKLPALIHRAQDAVSEHADADVPHPLKQMRGGAGKLATLIAEIRNATDGAGGHGSVELASWVAPHHVRFVADLAVAWSRYMLSAAEGVIEPN